MAFPAISAGVYRFPRARAARIAVETVREFGEASGVERVVFCCFGEEMARVYREALTASV